jgi:hypothetical protein
MSIEAEFKKGINDEDIEEKKKQLRIKLTPYIDKEIAEIPDAEIPLHLVQAKKKELEEKNPNASKSEAQWYSDARQSIKKEMFNKRLEEEIEKSL